MYPQYYNQYQRQELVRVNGENGARAYMMPPNSQAIVIDESNPIIYLLVTDGAGYKTVTPYKITPVQPQNDIRTLEERIEKLEKLYESNITKPSEQ